MKPLRLVLILGAFLIRSTAPAATPVKYQWGVYKPGPSGKVILVDWFSPEGKKRLFRSKFSQDFFQLAHAYQAQINPVYASVASAVMVLNAMRLPKHGVPSQPSLEIKTPKAMGDEVLPFPAFSQLTFLNDATDKVKDRKLIELRNVTPQNENDKTAFKPGIGLEDLKGMFKVYEASAEVTFADKPEKEGAPAFRKAIQTALADSTHFVLVNFKGDTFGAATGGTMSPLGAYDQKTDSVLILDVTAHKNPWYWVPLDALYASMHTQYDGNWRGYLVVSDGLPLQ